MSDPYVRMDGAYLDVGVDHDTVTIYGYRLTMAQAEEFAGLFIFACWEAGRRAARMAAEGEIEVTCT